MADQTHSIHSALKKLMRSRGRTYAEAAQVLSLSEASIKRLFSKEALSLSRLEALCDWLHVDILDLVRMSREHEPLTTQLSEEQESELLADGGLLLLSHLLLNNWKFEEILETYALTRPELTRQMFRLQEIGLVEVLPFDRVRLKTARNFTWRKDGPVQRYFADRVLKEFLASSFEEPGEKMEFISGMLSRKSILHMQERIAGLAKEMDQLVEGDLGLPAEERLGSSLCVAFRPWEFSEFARFRRFERTKAF
ncbi:MAG TPA: helix-turn-helix transcriptional regulator [Xanthomonadales bacterium]|nr:helix-turn-helix transcriptional regulator [Xanthomonadales bacterium]